MARAQPGAPWRRYSGWALVESVTGVSAGGPHSLPRREAASDRSFDERRQALQQRGLELVGVRLRHR